MARIGKSAIGRAARIALVAASAISISYCGEQGRFAGPSTGGGGGGGGGTGADVTPPVPRVILPGGPADTVVDITDSLLFTVRVTDSARVANLRVRVRGLGGFTLDTVPIDTTFPATPPTQAYERIFKLPLPVNAAGQRLAIVASAIDGANNSQRESVTVRVDDPQPPAVLLLAPSSATIVANGSTFNAIVRAADPSGIRQMGARLFTRNALNQPVTISGDSSLYSQRLTTRTDTFQIAVPNSLAPGTYTLHAFAVDSSVKVNAVSTADFTIVVADTALPFGSFITPTALSQIVAGDSVLVTFRAQDLTGLASVEFRGVARRGNPALGTQTIVERFVSKTVILAGRPTDTTVTRYLNAVLTDSTPETVDFEAVLRDAAGNTRTVTLSAPIIQGPFVTATAPAQGSTQSVGTAIPVSVVGRDPASLAWLGYTTSGALSVRDSVAIPPGTIQTTQNFTLVVGASAPTGQVQLQPFAVGQGGRRFTGAPVTFALADTLRPSLAILNPLVDSLASSGDSILVRVRVQDNRGVGGVEFRGLAHRGNRDLGTDQTVERYASRSISFAGTVAVTDTTVARYMRANADTTTEPVWFVVRVVDVNGNSRSDSVRIQLGNRYVRFINPVHGDQIRLNADSTRILPRIEAYSPGDTILYLGYEASGRITRADSAPINRPATAGQHATELTIHVEDNQPLGSVVLTPFARTRAARFTGQPITIHLIDGSIPRVRFIAPTTGFSIPAGDSLFVRVEVIDDHSLEAVAISGHHTVVTPLLDTVVVPRYQRRDFRIDKEWPQNPPSNHLFEEMRDTVARYLQATTDSSVRSDVWIVAQVIDKAGNVGYDSVRISVTLGAFVRGQPVGGSQVAVGSTATFSIRGFDSDGLLFVGYEATGALVASDSVSNPSPTDSLTQLFSLPTSAGTPLGTITIRPFGVSTGNARFTGAPFTIAVVDTVTPAITVLGPGADSAVGVGDSVLVRVRVQDNRGVSSLSLEGFALRGDSALGTDELISRLARRTVSFPRPVIDTTITRYLRAVPGAFDVEPVHIIIDATDVTGNVARAVRRVQLIPGPAVGITSPTAPAVLPIGTNLAITVSGFDPDSVLRLGFLATGAVSGGDSASFVSPLATSRTVLLSSLAVPGTALGQVTVTPFMVDRLGNRLVGSPLQVTLSDTARPSVSIVTPAVSGTNIALGDSVLVEVLVGDNLGVSTVTFTGEARRGDASLGTERVVPRFSPVTAVLNPPDTDSLVRRYLRMLATDSTSETVHIVAMATDASGNSQSDTIQVRLVSGPVVTLVRPSSGTTTSPGKSVIIEVRATDRNGVRYVGWRATGVMNLQDSVIRAPVSGDLPDTTTFVDTLVIGPTLGTFAITPFAADSLGDPSGIAPGVTVTVLSAASDASPPVVTQVVARRVEASDSVVVRAVDQGGVRRLGFYARRDSIGGVLVAADSTALLPGTETDVSRTFNLGLPDTLPFPSQVVVFSFAEDSLGNRDSSVAETLTVVAGRTFRLPAGSVIADAIYNRNRRELYLSNITFDRIEVFSLASNSFVASIPVGSRPWGLSMWPRDTAGAYRDTLIVANSGGTNLSIVDLVNRIEIRRHRLPNYHIQAVKTATTDAGGTQINVTEYEVSDRPQYVAATCRVDGSGNCATVLAVYSTTPTPAQTGELANRGYVAWENLTTPGEGHLFWEPAAVGGAGSGDTLQLIATRFETGAAVDTILVGAGAGKIVNITGTLTYQDTTFVRASGNFLRALVGEGGTDDGFARVLMYDPNAGMQVDSGSACTLVGYTLPCNAIVDNGVSSSTYVSDFLVNRASPVRSIAINHSGRTALVRADSVYAFDVSLRQTGILQVGGAAVGMDFHPCNNFDANTRISTPLPGCAASYTPSERLVFAARPDSSIDVFDTYFYGRVTDTTATGATIPIPIRNALIGPVRVATDAGETVLFGLTARGLVQVRLPNVTNSLFPVRRRPMAAGGGSP